MLRCVAGEIEREAYLDAICILDNTKKDILHLKE
jgi:hypothetical protein